MSKYSSLTKGLHLTLALSVITAFILHEFELLISIHIMFGILATTAAIFLIFRPKKLILSPKELVRYIKEYRTYDSGEYKNPASSWSAIALLALAVLVGLAGFALIGAKFGSGMLAFLYTDDKEFIHTIKEVHEVLAKLLMLTAVAHVAGVLAEKIFKKTDIVKTMVGFRPLEFVMIGGAMVAVAGLLYTGLSTPLSTKPRHLIDYEAKAPNFFSECKECHVFYPTTMVSDAQFALMFDNLADHYGDDASLEGDLLEQVKREYAVVKSSKKEVFEITANQSVTETKLWKKKHDEFSDDFWKANELKKTNCKACHLQIEQNSYNTLMMPIKYGL